MKNGRRLANAPSGPLKSKGWEFSCPLNFIVSLPESLTQGLLIGKLLEGGLGVTPRRVRGGAARGASRRSPGYIYIYIYIYIERERDIYIYMYIYK